MRAWMSKTTAVSRAFYAAAAVIALGATGCQVDVAGQTLPSPYWYQDDVQYFPTGPDMKVEREAAAQRAYLQQTTQQSARRDTQGRVLR
jgi:hypothetical protein